MESSCFSNATSRRERETDRESCPWSTLQTYDTITTSLRGVERPRPKRCSYTDLTTAVDSAMSWERFSHQHCCRLLGRWSTYADRRSCPVGVGSDFTKGDNGCMCRQALSEAKSCRYIDLDHLSLTFLAFSCPLFKFCSTEAKFYGFYVVDADNLELCKNNRGC